MAEEEWGEPFRLEKAFSSINQKIYFNGGDMGKFGLWMFENTSTILPTCRWFEYKVSHLGSCKMKILKSTGFFHPHPFSAAGSEQGDMIVGGQEEERGEMIVGDQAVRPRAIRTITRGTRVDGLLIRIDFQKSKNCPCYGCRRISALSISSKAFESFYSTDVVFQVGEVEVPAHKAILSARYEYFRAQFGPGWKESKTNRVPIEDADPEVFRETIRFVYSGELPADLASEPASYLPVADRFGILDLKSACSEALKKSVTTVNVMDIFALADLYQCPELVKSCADVMKTMVTVENIMEILLLAQNHQLPALKEECFRKIKEFQSQGQMSLEMLRSLHVDPQLMAEIIISYN